MDLRLSFVQSVTRTTEDTRLVHHLRVLLEHRIVDSKGRLLLLHRNTRNLLRERLLLVLSRLTGVRNLLIF